MNAIDLINLLGSYRLSTQTEKDMQSDIEQVLTAACIDFSRERKLTALDIVDFLVGTVGVECKIKGAYGSVLSQLSRYARSELVTEILLVTTKASHRRLRGVKLNGKVVQVVWINNL